MFTVVAILFVGTATHLAYVGERGTIETFFVENSQAGVQELTGKLPPILRSAPGIPVVCMGAAEGSSLHGPIFEQLVLEQSIRRFMYAQPKYLSEAKAASLPTESPTTLLKACQAVFPSPKA